MSDARSNSYITLRQRKPFKVVVCAITLVAFFVNTFAYDLAWAGASAPSELTSVSSDRATGPGLIRELDPATFKLPDSLGTIKDSWSAGSAKPTIIHIQDAHCNYYAQTKIAEMVEYLNKEYGIDVVNMEGAAWDFDLTPFTDIKDKALRMKASDYFMKEGLVNGPEYFAVNNPEAVTLWGIEDTGLYVDNLKVYLNSLKNKADVDRYIAALSSTLSSFKAKVYSKGLLEFDLKYSQYKANNIEFKDYLDYLIQTAKDKAIDIKKLTNIYLLSQALDEESSIDFTRANNERDDLIDRLQKKISKRLLEELVLKSVDFKSDKLSQKDYYSYLVSKAKTVNLDLKSFPELEKYVVYISMYDAINKTSVMDELALLEDFVKEALYRNDEERRLSGLSKNLALLKNIFCISITRQDYEYYKKNEKAFKVSNYTSFINDRALPHNISVKLDPDISDLDRYREEISKFFEYSFKRDRAFIKNMRLAHSSKLIAHRENSDQSAISHEPSANRAAILITGGFHSDNLAELFRKNGISYVSIMPNFRNSDDYECPYYKILSGENKSTIRGELPAVLKSGLMPARQLNQAITDAVKGLSVALPKSSASTAAAGALKNITVPGMSTPGVDIGDAGVERTIKGKSGREYIIDLDESESDIKVFVRTIEGQDAGVMSVDILGNQPGDNVLVVPKANLKPEYMGDGLGTIIYSQIRKRLLAKLPRGYTMSAHIENLESRTAIARALAGKILAGQSEYSDDPRYKELVNMASTFITGFDARSERIRQLKQQLNELAKDQNRIARGMERGVKNELAGLTERGLEFDHDVVQRFLSNIRELRESYPSVLNLSNEDLVNLPNAFDPSRKSTMINMYETRGVDPKTLGIEWRDDGSFGFYGMVRSAPEKFLAPQIPAAAKPAAPEKEIVFENLNDVDLEPYGTRSENVPEKEKILSQVLTMLKNNISKAYPSMAVKKVTFIGRGVHKMVFKVEAEGLGRKSAFVVRLEYWDMIRDGYLTTKTIDEGQRKVAEEVHIANDFAEQGLAMGGNVLINLDKEKLLKPGDNDLYKFFRNNRIFSITIGGLADGRALNRITEPEEKERVYTSVAHTVMKGWLYTYDSRRHAGRAISDMKGRQFVLLEPSIDKKSPVVYIDLGNAIDIHISILIEMMFQMLRNAYIEKGESYEIVLKAIKEEIGSYDGDKDIKGQLMEYLGVVNYMLDRFGENKNVTMTYNDALRAMSAEDIISDRPYSVATDPDGMRRIRVPVGSGVLYSPAVGRAFQIITPALAGCTGICIRAKNKYGRYYYGLEHIFISGESDAPLSEQLRGVNDRLRASGFSEIDYFIDFNPSSYKNPEGQRDAIAADKGFGDAKFSFPEDDRAGFMQNTLIEVNSEGVLVKRVDGVVTEDQAAGFEGDMYDWNESFSRTVAPIAASATGPTAGSWLAPTKENARYVRKLASPAETFASLAFGYIVSVISSYLGYDGITGLFAGAVSAGLIYYIGHIFNNPKAMKDPAVMGLALGTSYVWMALYLCLPTLGISEIIFAAGVTASLIWAHYYKNINSPLVQPKQTPGMVNARELMQGHRERLLRGRDSVSYIQLYRFLRKGDKAQGIGETLMGKPEMIGPVDSMRESFEATYEEYDHMVDGLRNRDFVEALMGMVGIIDSVFDLVTMSITPNARGVLAFTEIELPKATTVIPSATIMTIFSSLVFFTGSWIFAIPMVFYAITTMHTLHMIMSTRNSLAHEMRHAYIYLLLNDLEEKGLIDDIEDASKRLGWFDEGITTRLSKTITRAELIWLEERILRRVIENISQEEEEELASSDRTPATVAPAEAAAKPAAASDRVALNGPSPETHPAAQTSTANLTEKELNGLYDKEDYIGVGRALTQNAPGLSDEDAQKRNRLVGEYYLAVKQGFPFSVYSNFAKNFNEIWGLYNQICALEAETHIGIEDLDSGADEVREAMRRIGRRVSPETEDDGVNITIGSMIVSIFKHTLHPDWLAGVYETEVGREIAAADEGKGLLQRVKEKRLLAEKAEINRKAYNEKIKTTFGDDDRDKFGKEFKDTIFKPYIGEPVAPSKGWSELLLWAKRVLGDDQPLTSHLVDKILSNMDAIANVDRNLRLVVTDMTKHRGGDVGGVYWPAEVVPDYWGHGTDVIGLHVSEESSIPSDKIFARVLVHEYAHAMTARLYYNDEEFRNEVNRLYELVKYKMPENESYGMKNEKEFLAEAFAKPEFQKLLMGIRDVEVRDDGKGGVEVIRTERSVHDSIIDSALREAGGMVSPDRGLTLSRRNLNEIYDKGEYRKLLAIITDGESMKPEEEARLIALYSMVKSGEVQLGVYRNFVINRGEIYGIVDEIKGLAGDEADMIEYAVKAMDVAGKTGLVDKIFAKLYTIGRLVYPATTNEISLIKKGSAIFSILENKSGYVPGSYGNAFESVPDFGGIFINWRDFTMKNLDKKLRENGLGKFAFFKHDAHYNDPLSMLNVFDFNMKDGTTRKGLPALIEWAQSALSEKDRAAASEVIKYIQKHGDVLGTDIRLVVSQLTDSDSYRDAAAAYFSGDSIPWNMKDGGVKSDIIFINANRIADYPQEAARDIMHECARAIAERLPGEEGRELRDLLAPAAAPQEAAPGKNMIPYAIMAVMGLPAYFSILGPAGLSFSETLFYGLMPIITVMVSHEFMHYVVAKLTKGIYKTRFGIDGSSPYLAAYFEKGAPDAARKQLAISAVPVLFNIAAAAASLMLMPYAAGIDPLAEHVMGMFAIGNMITIVLSMFGDIPVMLKLLFSETYRRQFQTKVDRGQLMAPEDIAAAPRTSGDESVEKLIREARKITPTEIESIKREYRIFIKSILWDLRSGNILVTFLNGDRTELPMNASAEEIKRAIEGNKKYEEKFKTLNEEADAIERYSDRLNLLEEKIEKNYPGLIDYILPKPEPGKEPHESKDYIVRFKPMGLTREVPVDQAYGAIEKIVEELCSDILKDLKSPRWSGVTQGLDPGELKMLAYFVLKWKSALGTPGRYTLYLAGVENSKIRSALESIGAEAAGTIGTVPSVKRAGPPSAAGEDLGRRANTPVVLPIPFMDIPAPEHDVVFKMLKERKIKMKIPDDKRVLVLNFDEHSDKFGTTDRAEEPLSMLSTWAADAEKDGLAYVPHFQSDVTEHLWTRPAEYDRLKSEVNGHMARGEVFEVWVTLDYDFFNAILNTKPVDENELMRQMKEIAGFLKENNIWPTMIIPAISRSCLPENISNEDINKVTRAVFLTFAEQAIPDLASRKAALESFMLRAALPVAPFASVLDENNRIGVPTKEAVGVPIRKDDTSKMTLGTTAPGRNSMIDAVIIEHLKAKGILNDCAVADIGVGYPAVTTGELADKLARASINGKNRVIGIDTNIPDYVLEFPSQDGTDYNSYVVFFERSDKGDEATFVAVRHNDPESGQHNYSLIMDKDKVSNIKEAAIIIRDNIFSTASPSVREGRLDYWQDGTGIAFDPIRREAKARRNLDFIKGGFDMPGIEEGSLDVVRAANVFLYYDSNTVSKAMASIARKLKPGGIFILASDEAFIIYESDGITLKPRELSIRTAFEGLDNLSFNERAERMSEGANNPVSVGVEEPFDGYKVVAGSATEAIGKTALKLFGKHGSVRNDVGIDNLIGKEAAAYLNARGYAASSDLLGLVRIDLSAAEKLVPIQTVINRIKSQPLKELARGTHSVVFTRDDLDYVVKVAGNKIPGNTSFDNYRKYESNHPDTVIDYAVVSDIEIVTPEGMRAVYPTAVIHEKVELISDVLSRAFNDNDIAKVNELLDAFVKVHGGLMRWGLTDKLFTTSAEPGAPAREYFSNIGFSKKQNKWVYIDCADLTDKTIDADTFNKSIENVMSWFPYTALPAESKAAFEAKLRLLKPRAPPVAAMEPAAAEAKIDTIESRRAAVTEAFKDANGRSTDVRIVQGVPKGGMLIAQNADTANGIGRILAKNGYGVRDGTKQIYLFEINPDDAAATAKNMEKAMLNAYKDLRFGGKIVIFAPQMKDDWDIAQKIKEIKKGDNITTVLKDAYSDYEFPDIVARMALARNISSYYGSDEAGKKAALKVINELLGRIAMGNVMLDAIDDLSELTIRIKPVNYEKDIAFWKNAQLATAIAA